MHGQVTSSVTNIDSSLEIQHYNEGKTHSKDFLGEGKGGSLVRARLFTKRVKSNFLINPYDSKLNLFR